MTDHQRAVALLTLHLESLEEFKRSMAKRANLGGETLGIMAQFNEYLEAGDSYGIVKALCGLAGLALDKLSKMDPSKSPSEWLQLISIDGAMWEGEIFGWTDETKE